MPQVICQSCAQLNPDVTRVCRYCGHALRPDDARRPTNTQRPIGYAPPQGSYTPSHDWASSAPLPAPPTYAASPVVGANAQEFRCPYCQNTQPPVIATRVSTGGWIVFAALLVACFPLCFIGLFIKEQYPMCSWCRASLS